MKYDTENEPLFQRGTDSSGLIPNPLKANAVWSFHNGPVRIHTLNPLKLTGPRDGL